MLCSTQKHTKAICFARNRDIDGFRAAGLLAVFLLKDFIVAAERFSIPDVRAPVNSSAHCCPALLCSREDGFYRAVMPLQQKPLFRACLCGSVQRLRGFVCGDYRRGDCRSYLFIQVHASIPHRLSSSLSIEAFFCSLQKSSWRLTLLSSQVIWNGRRRANFLFTFLWIFNIATAVSLSFARINVKRSKQTYLDECIHL